jgi:integrase
MCGRTDASIVPRQSTKLTDWKAAEALRTSLVAKSQDETVHGPRLAECAEKYLQSRVPELGDKASGQHKLLLARLQAYCEQRGVYFAREMTVDLLEQFKVDGLPGLADTSKSLYVAKLRCFLRDALRRGWITDPLADKVTTHPAVYEQKSPYTDEEVDKILAGALELNGGTHGYSSHPQTFRLLLELMLATGMRVGDALRYNPAVSVRGEYLWVYAYQPQKQKKTKQPKAIEAYLPDGLKTAIDACTWLSPTLPFHFGSASNRSYLSSEVYMRMKTIGTRCGIADCRPHRLRDTFAVNALLRGLALEDVSRLLGHSSVKITEMYYAKWTIGRKARLERMVSESLMHP